MSDKLINNPLEEESPAPQRQKKRAPIKLKIGFLDKDKIISPILLLLCCALILTFKIAAKLVPDIIGSYLGVVILLTVIFIIPAYLFYKLTKKLRARAIISELKIAPPKINHIFLIFFGALFAGICIFFLNLIFRLRVGYTDGFYLYNTFFTGKLPIPDTPIFPFIAFAAVPALCEELMFRGIFHASYEKKGFMAAAIVSALMYAVISLDVRTFVSHLFLGLFLSFMLYLTKSIVSTFIVNLLCKCFMLFFGTNLQSYIQSSSNKAVFFTVIVGLLLISLSIFSFECAKIFKASDNGKYKPPVLQNEPKKICCAKVISSISTVPMILCVMIFIVAIFIK